MANNSTPGPRDHTWTFKQESVDLNKGQPGSAASPPERTLDVISIVVRWGHGYRGLTNKSLSRNAWFFAKRVTTIDDITTAVLQWDLVGRILEVLQRGAKEQIVSEAAIEHTAHARYISNTSAFHNVHLLHRILRSFVPCLLLRTKTKEQQPMSGMVPNCAAIPVGSEKSVRISLSRRRRRQKFRGRSLAEEVDKVAASRCKGGANVVEARAQPIPQTE
ncbi:hypothetical protein FB45DRAFT_877013 [Roridomyces roridus]|uniref:Uncharacterized protein n=1 Tax=Roridomyces roridus TaxID=1738132 RepID=A0AAD7FAG4_9AGAR|nr:hypothetical protein FB45DRAFT_877013 [Roridomyces roridus]